MKNKTPLLKRDGFQSLIASLICIILGLLIGYIVLLFINPAGASEAILAVIKNFWNYSRANLQIKNFWNYSRANLQIKNFGNTLVKTAPLLMCALSVLFAYKVGLFNIGTAGQYVVGSCACLYGALQLHLGWFACLLLAMLVGAVYGALVGLLVAIAIIVVRALVDTTIWSEEDLSKQYNIPVLGVVPQLAALEKTNLTKE